MCTPTAINTYQTEWQNDTSTKADTADFTFCPGGGDGNATFYRQQSVSLKPLQQISSVASDVLIFIARTHHIVN